MSYNGMNGTIVLNTYRGQSLVHSHEGGDEPHGYFGHPEDFPRDDSGDYTTERTEPK